MRQGFACKQPVVLYILVGICHSATLTSALLAMANLQASRPAR